MVLHELFDLLTRFLHRETDEIDVRIGLLELPPTEEVIYAHSILDNTMRLIAYIDYLQVLIYHDVLLSDDSDDII